MDVNTHVFSGKNHVWSLTGAGCMPCGLAEQLKYLDSALSAMCTTLRLANNRTSVLAFEHNQIAAIH